MGQVVVRPFDPQRDETWAHASLDEAFGGPGQARRGELIDVLRLPGLVGERDGERIGLLLYDPGNATDRDGEAELAALTTPVRGAGAGTALVTALSERVPDRPIWVVTTNDNLEALRFYQRMGFRLRELRAGAVDDARRRLKPQIPRTGRHGIPIRDEIELVLVPGDRPVPDEAARADTGSDDAGVPQVDHVPG